MDRLDALVAASWQGAALGLVAFVLTRTFPRLPARFRAWLWWAVGLKMAIVALGAFTLRLPLLPAPQMAAGLGADAIALPTPGAAAPTTLPVHTTLAATGAPSDPLALLTVAWLAGVVAFGLVLIVQGLALGRLLRRARPLPQGAAAEEARRLGVELGLGRRPEVRLSAEVGAPMVVRPWRPTVVLPEAFAEGVGPEELRMALAHELAHVRRGDLWLALVPALAQALLWFNPVAWLAAREWATEREAACDDAALQATGGSPADYGRLLMRIVSDDHRGGFGHALGATAAYHTLRRRIQTMKTYVPRPNRALRLGGASFAVVALLAALPWEVVAQTSDAPKERNLIANPGFESGLQGWDIRMSSMEAANQIEAKVDTSQRHSGRASLRFSKTLDTYFPVLQYNQSLDMTGATRRLKVGMWVKAEKVHKATMGVFFNEERNEWGAYVGDPAGGGGTIDHDWKYYNAVLDVPVGTRQLTLALQMYGSGTVWIDDVSAAFVPNDTKLKRAIAEESEDPLADVKDVPSQDLKAGNDPYKRYFLVGKPAPGANKLLVVLPGGDGGEAFNPFVRRVWKNALPPGWMIAEPVAPQWSDDQKDHVVWPTKKFRWTGMRFSTEELVEAVVKDAATRASIDPANVYVMGWSSGGPATYATALTSGAVKGALVVSSVYYPQQMPAPGGGRGRPFYLLQSPDDPVTTYGFALTAQKELTSGGAKVQLVNLKGGHGFGEDPYGSLRKGVEWLVANSK